MPEEPLDRATFLAGLRAFAASEAGPHPEAEELIGYFEGELTPEQARRLRLHLARCLACAELAVSLEATYTDPAYWDPVQERPAGAESAIGRQVVSFVLSRLRKLGQPAPALAVLSAADKDDQASRVDFGPPGPLTVVVSLSGSDEVIVGVMAGGRPVVGAEVTLERLSLEPREGAVVCARATTDERGEATLGPVANFPAPASHERYRVEVRSP